ncbi:uncharacterized protein A4U43_C08F19350, partial [Asparagus officinalis]
MDFGGGDVEGREAVEDSGSSEHLGLGGEKRCHDLKVSSLNIVEEFILEVRGSLILHLHHLEVVAARVLRPSLFASPLTPVKLSEVLRRHHYYFRAFDGCDHNPKIISCIIRMYLPEAMPTWKKYPEEWKEVCYKEFE